MANPLSALKTARKVKKIDKKPSTPAQRAFGGGRRIGTRTGRVEGAAVGTAATGITMAALSNMSLQELRAAKRKAEQMRKELKDYISFTMGPSAWDELVATEAKIRKQKKEQEYRKAEMQEAIITWTISGFLLLMSFGALGFILYMVA